MSENKFKVENLFYVGDKVKCNSRTPYLSETKEYIVQDVYSHAIQLEGVTGWYNPGYFKLVEENKMQKQFTKNDLKTGMRVVHRKGKVGLIVKDIGIIAYEDNGHNPLHEFSDAMFSVYPDKEIATEYDILEVYEGSIKNHFTNHQFKGNLLWKREEKSPEQIEAEKITQEIESLKLRLEELSKKL